MPRNKPSLPGHARKHVEFFRGLAAPSAHDLQVEPSLTLCSPEVFARFGGRAAAEALRFMLATGALDEAIMTVRESPGLDIRISTYTLWLDTGQVPSSRYDWHIDRIGAISGSGTDERYDAADYTGRRSFAVLSHFVPDSALAGRAGLDVASTEFVVDPGAIFLPGRWLSTSEVQERITSSLSGGYNAVHAGNGVGAAFSARAVHRPGYAPRPGWRFMIRVGAYLADPPCSPYIDHIPRYNPFCHRTAAGSRLRAVGGKDTSAVTSSWSYGHDDADATSVFTECGLVRDEAAASVAEGIRNAI